MSGSVFFSAITVLFGLVLLAILGAGFIWILPIAALALVPLLGATLLTRVRNSSIVQDEPTGIPASQEASYTPQFDPSDRAT